MRRALGWTAAVALLAVLSLFLWDFLQLGRSVPAMASVGDQANLVVVEKSARKLSLLRDGKTLKVYDVSLGRAPSGHKQQEGDGRTPEGRYLLDSKNQRSRFHLALHVSYPNPADRNDAQRRGVSPGGDIMIHGLPNGLGSLGRLFLFFDWTDGCVEVTNSEIEEIWSLVGAGTPIDIKP